MAYLDEIWATPPVQLTLADEEVHLWRAYLDQSAEVVHRLGQTLTADEQERANRFYFEQDRLHFIVGRGVLRVILGQYLEVEPGQIRFRYNQHGKPVLPETLKGTRLGFNVAHSSGLALYAFVLGQEIGIDLEYIRPIPEVEQIAERFFSAQETARLRTLPPEQRQEAFFYCWTCKEAYLKHLGDGLTHPLNQFEVSFTPGEPPRLLHGVGQPQAGTGWLMQTLTPAVGYVAALALPKVAGPTWQLKRWQWSWLEQEENI